MVHLFSPTGSVLQNSVWLFSGKPMWLCCGYSSNDTGLRIPHGPRLYGSVCLPTGPFAVWSYYPAWAVATKMAEPSHYKIRAALCSPFITILIQRTARACANPFTGSFLFAADADFVHLSADACSLFFCLERRVFLYNRRHRQRLLQFFHDHFHPLMAFRTAGVSSSGNSFLVSIVLAQHFIRHCLSLKPLSVVWHRFVRDIIMAEGSAPSFLSHPRSQVFPLQESPGGDFPCNIRWLFPSLQWAPVFQIPELAPVVWPWKIDAPSCF